MQSSSALGGTPPSSLASKGVGFGMRTDEPPRRMNTHAPLSSALHRHDNTPHNNTSHASMAPGVAEEPHQRRLRHSVVGRGRSMMEGWSAIDKVMPFTHAVGRVSDGKGSAILIALPDNCTPKPNRRKPSRGDVLHHNASQTEPIHLSKQDPEAEDNYLRPLGLVLTTSFVLSDCESAMERHVTFLEKCVAGTSIQLGRVPRPFSVGVRADRKFVTSVKPKKKSKSWKDEDFQSMPDSLIYSELSRLMDDDEEEEEIGFAMSYVDIDPLENEPGWQRSDSHEGGAMDDDMMYGSGFGASNASSLGYGSMGSAREMGSNPRHRSPHAPNMHSLPQRYRHGAPPSASGATSRGPLQSPKDIDGLHLIKPLPLPLLVSRIPPIKIGDPHLMVTHINGIERSYVALKVTAVYEDYCEYESGSLLCDFSSGGAVFDMQGNFIALQHQCGVHCIGLLTHSIVRHLFQSDLLGLCCCPISDLPLAILQNGGISDKQRADMFNEPFSILQSSHVMDVGDKGNQLLNYKDIERVRAREGGFLTANRVPSFEEVYDEFFADNFESLLHMLFAFWYNSPLTRRVLENIMARKYAPLHPDVATAGGIGIMMELMDGHPEDGELIESCLAALTPLCLHASNLSVFIQVNGIPSVMETLSMYLHKPIILQWGVHCLMCATDAHQTCQSTRSVELFLRASGLDLVTYALKKHGLTNRNLTSWIGTLLNNVLVCNTGFVTWMHQKGLPIAVIQFILAFRGDRLVLSGLLPFYCHVVTLVREYHQQHVVPVVAAGKLGGMTPPQRLSTPLPPQPAPAIVTPTAPTPTAPSSPPPPLIVASPNAPGATRASRSPPLAARSATSAAIAPAATHIFPSTAAQSMPAYILPPPPPPPPRVSSASTTNSPPFSYTSPTEAEEQAGRYQSTIVINASSSGSSLPNMKRQLTEDHPPNTKPLSSIIGSGGSTNNTLTTTAAAATTSHHSNNQSYNPGQSASARNPAALTPPPPNATGVPQSSMNQVLSIRYHPFSGLPTVLAQFLSFSTTKEAFLDLLMELCESESIERHPNSADFIGQIADIFSVFLYFQTSLKPGFWTIIDDALFRIRKHLPAERVLIQKLEEVLQMRPSLARPGSSFTVDDGQTFGVNAFLSVPPVK